MKITSRQREILLSIEENGYVPFNANASIRNRMENTLGLYESVGGNAVLTDKGRTALKNALLAEIAGI